MDSYKRVDRKLMYEGSIVQMFNDTMEFADGSLHEWDFIKHPGGAGSIAVKPDGRILMVRQYRNALERETLEIPAGGLGCGEDRQVCAVRELEEETGYRAGHSELLAEICSNVALMDECIGVYLCTDLVMVDQHLDEGEYLNVESYTIEELMEMVTTGKIRDAKTVCGILAYYARLHR